MPEEDCKLVYTLTILCDFLAFLLERAIISLQNDKNEVFATCSVTDDTAVEKCLDSGRYFVLRITNAQGKHAFIGIAFNERNDSFDFNVALQEHKSECEREDQAAKGVTSVQAATRDLSLKEGQTIKVNIAGSSVRYIFLFYCLHHSPMNGAGREEREES